MTELTPNDLRYTKTHEWIKVEADGTWLIGITDHAQHLLGDLVYVQLPTLGRDIEAGAEICVVESVKAAADVYSPAQGKVVAINETLTKQPELINQEPYAEGWIFRLQPTDANATANLLTAEQYLSNLN